MTVLLLNQAFYPDVVASAQCAADLAVALTNAGHQVTVIASRRAYDNPAEKFAAAESWRGVQIHRVSATALGKGARWRRAVDFASFLVACAFRLLVLRPRDVVIAMTTPPLISFLAALFVRAKGGQLVSWIMDLNPDEAIAAGWLRAQSPIASLLERVLHFSLTTSAKIIVLDRFMRDRIIRKGIPPQRVVIAAPWAHDSDVRYDQKGRDEFRARYGLSDKFVVMYSGNHSPCHPLDTLLEAARRLTARVDVAFCFIGGGSEFSKVREFAARHALTNVLCLPYQPLERLSGSLSAADLHIVVMGDRFVGIVHPSKIYNILAVGMSFLYIGPEPGHIGDIMAAPGVDEVAFAARHGEVDRVLSHIVSAAWRRGRRRIVDQTIMLQFSQRLLIPRVICAIEFSPADAQTSATVAAAH